MRLIRNLPLFLALAAPAFASDGVLEINQACAAQVGGCFPGDTAGFPVTITSPGSYRLTSNLTVPDENTDGILISTNDVGIDLNNFAILGPVTCLGFPCAPATGTGSGVRGGVQDRGISVKNGSIAGMGLYGVGLGVQAEVTNLRVRWNRVCGIAVFDGSKVSSSTARNNGCGIVAAGDGATISGNTIFQNESDGITCTNGSTISGNTSSYNGGNGIIANNGSTISGNTAYDNGDTTNPTLDDGIECSAGCIVRGNTVRANHGYGLRLGTDSAYSDNVVSGNTTGTVTGAGSANGRGGNYCAGTGTVSPNCP